MTEQKTIGEMVFTMGDEKLRKFFIDIYNYLYETNGENENMKKLELEELGSKYGLR